MTKGKSDGKKKKKKSSQLVIRIEAAERDAFVKLCDQLDTTAAREIRRFMRGWVAENASKPDEGQSDPPAGLPVQASEEAALPQQDAPPAEKPAPATRRKPSKKVAV